MDTPAGTLHAKDIEVGLGLDSRDGEHVYLDMKEDRENFHNPIAVRVACYELTEAGERWAEALLADHEAGRRPWLRDWEHTTFPPR